MTDPQISLPIPAHAAGIGGCQTVSGPAHGEVPGSLTFTATGLTPVGQGAISHGKTGIGYHTNGKILKPWRSLVQAAAVEATGRHAYAAPKPIKVPKGEKRPRPPAICTTCGILRKTHGLYLGAVGMYAVVTFRKPKSAPGRRFPITSNIGDYDHHGRAIGDALTGVVWADDSQVVDGRTVKAYIGEHPDALTEPGVVIRVWEVSTP